MNRFEKVLDYAVLVAIMILFWSLFNFKLALTDTHVAGGDMISHPWISKSLIEQWSQHRFWGWNHGWFAGFPFLYFYFYPIYMIVALFQMLGATEAASFKIMVLFVVTCVPFLYYTSARRWMSIPYSALFTAIGLSIFLNEFESRWGGNFKSLLAGQASHQLGLVMMVGFFSYLVTKETKKPGAIIFFALAIMCHVYSALYVFLLFVCYLAAVAFEKRKIHFVFEEAKGPMIGLGLSMFFWLPFLYYRQDTVAPLNHSDVSFAEVFRILQVTTPLYFLLYAGTIVFLLFSLIKKRPNYFLIFVLMLTVLSALSMPYLNGTPLLHIRLPAEIYLLSALTFVGGFSGLLLSRPLQWQLGGVLAVLVMQSFVPSAELDQVLPKLMRAGVKEIPNWWVWNMSGIEEKPNASDVFTVWEKLKSIDDPEGRISVEYFDYNAYGSPRIFELTPYMTGKPVMEGLLLESSPNYPSYYYLSMYINPDTWWPGFPTQFPKHNVGEGIKGFALYNVKYFVASQDSTKSELRALGNTEIFKNDRFSIFAVNSDSRIASVLEGELHRVAHPKPLMATVESFPESLKRIVAVDRGSVKDDWELTRTEFEEQKLVPLEGRWSLDKQSYIIEHTGATEQYPKKILYKISYFRNWQTDSEEPVQLVTPNLMLVETKKPKLTLTYRAGWPEKLSFLISLLSVGALIWTIIRERIHRRKA